MSLCLSVDASGAVCLWRLPTWELAFASPSALLQGASLVTNALDARGGGAAAAVGEAFEGESDEAAAAAGVAGLASAVVEAHILTMKEAHRPLLCLYIDHRAGAASAPQGAQGAQKAQGGQGQRLLLYRPFLPASLAAEAAEASLEEGDAMADEWGGEGGGTSACSVRFVRVPFRGLAAASEEDGDGISAAEAMAAAAAAAVALSPLAPRLVGLGALGGVGGAWDGAVVLLCVPRTLLCMVRDAIWPHELRPPTPGMSIACVAPFHVASCAHGLLMMSPEGKTHICSLRAPPAKAQPTRYDGAWPVTKMGLRATGHALALMPHCNAIAVAVSTAEPLPESTPSAAELLDLSPVAQLPAAVRYAESYERRLLDAKTWDTLDTFGFGEHEWVMCMRQMTLTREFAPPAPPPSAAGQRYPTYVPPPPPVRTPTLVIGTA